MNAIPRGEPEGWQATNASDAAESAIYERLRELFGAQGENLDYYISRAKPPTVDESARLLRDLRAEYRARVAADVNKRLENANV